MNDAVIVLGFIGDSSRLCHYWNSRFPFGLLAIFDRLCSAGGMHQFQTDFADWKLKGAL
jgi:hypothetical protein